MAVPIVGGLAMYSPSGISFSAGKAMTEADGESSSSACGRIRRELRTRNGVLGRPKSRLRYWHAREGSRAGYGIA